MKSKNISFTGISALLLGCVTSLMLFTKAEAAYVGEIKMFASSFCPKGYQAADGRLLEVNRYISLFSLYGDTYGGDGRIQFALPNLSGRVPVGVGRGDEFSDYQQGAIGGVEQVTLSAQQLPQHSHGVTAIPGTGKSMINLALGADKKDAVLDKPVQSSGANKAHENRMPYSIIRYCVAIDGIYPQRNQ